MLEATIKATFEQLQKLWLKAIRLRLLVSVTLKYATELPEPVINPQTGEEVKIAACKVPAFKAGKALKEAVNK